MYFDEQSNVTIVITSCGRFDLLKKTINSLDEFNTYPIKCVLITEDSGKNPDLDILPESWLKNTRIIINNPKLGQIRSVDLAYSQVDTDYIFHCEDDWCFYRSEFIEDSLKVLKNDSNALLVQLRDFNDDIIIHYDSHCLKNKKKVDDVEYSQLFCNDNIWGGFSFNPGLRRKSDYDFISQYDNGKSSDIRERELSIHYLSRGMYIAILTESAVKHIGWGSHILTEDEIKKRKKIKKVKVKYSLIGFAVGIFFSMAIFLLIGTH